MKDYIWKMTDYFHDSTIEVLRKLNLNVTTDDVEVEFNKLSVDTKLICFDHGQWCFIRIDHIYRNVLFYTILSGNNKGNNSYMDKDCLSFKMNLLPTILLLPNNINTSIKCDLLKIVKD